MLGALRGLACTGRLDPEGHAVVVAGVEAGPDARVDAQLVDHPAAENHDEDDDSQRGEVLLRATAIVDLVGLRQLALRESHSAEGRGRLNLGA
jgi:hypothetical protein